MSRITSLSLATALLLGTTGVTLAQTAVVISPEQETVIREYVVTQEVAPIEMPAEVTVEIGSTLPDTIELRPLEAPDLDVQYQYVVVDGRTVLVEPSTREIIHIVQ